MARPAEALLEFDNLQELLLGFSTCAPGQRALQALRFSSDREALEAGFATLGEAIESLAGGTEAGFGGLADPAPWIEQLERPGVTLEPKLLLDAAALAEIAYGARQTCFAARDRRPRLARSAAALADLRPAATAIRRAILPSGEISDDASPQLKRIRERHRRLRERTLELLRGTMRRLGETAGEQGYVTVRNNRYVIPVRAADRGAAPGVVHGASSTGQTLFVEPLEAVEQNNELVRLADAEAAEIARILEELTERLRNQLPLVAQTVAALGELDSVFARARFARRFDCVLPRFSDGSRLHLEAARHPVLEQALGARGRSMVPISLELGGAETVMVISGPNAGGKTVVLKTVGLAALCAQTAIPVAATAAELPLADRVLADIGDEQSITADLSTFSAHVLNLAAMLATASDRSLVLIDEIGTGTAPEEGSALAIALLEEFRARRALTLATTHHDRLKSYALAHPGMINAAVEFDTATLEPTYRLLVGLPGISSGIEIARRLGLPAAVVARARSEMAPEALEAGALIDNLHRLEEELHRRLGDAAAQRLRLEEERTRLRTEWVERQRKRVEELERQFREALARVEKEVGRLTADVEDRKLRAALEKQAAKRLGAIRSQARDEADAVVLQHRGEIQQDLGVAGEAPAAPIDPERLAPGMKVRVRGLAQPVVVRQRRDRSVEVQAGPLRMNVGVEDVLGIAEERGSPGPHPVSMVRDSGREGSAGSAPAVRGPMPEEAGDEIQVIGCRVEEAVRLVDRFLDRAALAGKPRIRIVHGYGTGALRRGLAEFLREHPHVEAISAETPERGGEAVTVVTLRSD